MANFPINKLSEDDINKAYRFIYLFEKEIHSKYGTFNFNDKSIEYFCKQYKINKKVKRNSKPSDNYFWFDTVKITGAPKNDFAHNLLRHIRNAMSHGNFKKGKSKKAFYTFEDYNKTGTQTMYGKINADLFWKYLNIVLHTSPLIDKKINFK
ncbi:MAG: hypothetical protein IJA04_05600 [Bacteroidaceae bacterium]|nr:hypothetical protein [Bacteroidaceae bacterium]